MKYFTAIAASLLLMFLLFISCKKDISNVGGEIPDLTTKVTSSISGFVTDENNSAVAGASVKAGAATLITDNFGYFEFKDVQVVKEAAVVTVSHNGYFKGIKTYIAKENGSVFFRIKLLPKTIEGSIQATAGGTVTLPNGLSISFPASGIKNAATNVAYTGQVNIAVKWLDPTSNDLIKTMPGDLRGINTNGYINGLRTYGMAAVELIGTSGELLQIADGKKAVISMPIPASIISSAPSTIPLWYFNEDTGLWMEEGNAVKTGNAYVGEVSHFSFWNCDVPGSYVEMSATLLNADNEPLQMIRVKVTVANDPGNYRWGFTNNFGHVSGFVPDNAQLIFTVEPDFCTGVIYTQNFTTVSSAISLGNIIVPASTIQWAHVSGTVTNCSNQPVASGSVFVNYNGEYTSYSVTNGNYSYATLACNTGLDIILTARDNSVMQESNPLNYTILQGINTVPVLHACGNLVLPYDGKFKLSGFHNRPQYNFRYVDVPMEMITVGTNTVAFYFVQANSYGHPIATSDTSLSWYGPIIAPKIVFDPVTHAVLSVQNMDTIPISVYTGPIPTNNHYDPVTRKIYVAWQYNNDVNRAFFDTLTYTGPR